MIADFYLMGASFQYPTGLSAEDLAIKIEDLARDCEYIRQYKTENRRFKHESIYDQEIYPNISMVDFLYSNIPAIKKKFGAEVLNALQMIVEKANDTNLSTKDIVELLDTHDEKNAYGLLCLHKINEVADAAINERYLVYDKQNWFAFRRHFLGLYPNDTVFFCKEAVKYFSNLHLHERNVGTMRPIYKDFVQKIITHLGYLNDDFNQYKGTPYLRRETLKVFSAACKLDEEATIEGNVKHKSKITFIFENDSDTMESICCEPHLKLCHSDKHPGDRVYYFHRIYFHEGKPNIQNGKILIGHIGKHIDFQ
jgi:hypothetical protein